MANLGKRLANSTYDWANNQGNPLLSEEEARYQDQAGTGNALGGEAANAYENDLQNGYNYGEQTGVLGLRTGDMGGTNVPGLEQLSTVSPEEAQANFLTPEEQAGIAGDPRAAYDPSKLALSSRYGTDLKGQVGATGSKLDQITGNKDLGLSSDFTSKYEMTPDQQNDIVNSAARDTSQVSQGGWEDAVRRNNAAGVGPLGMGALRARMSRNASSDAAAAATKARIAASAEAANRVKGAEDLRLGAAQTQAGMQTGATEYTGTQGVQAAQDVEGKRLAAEQDIANRGQAAEKESSDRATTLGTNRQTTQETNSQNANTRGMAANTALSSRYGQVGNTRLGQQNTGAAGLTGLAQLNSQNANTALGLKNQTIGTVGGVENNAAQTVTGAQQQPGIGSKLLGAGLGAAAAFFEDGGIATEPTNAILGENGPEAVIPLHGAGGSPDSRPIGGTDAQPNDPFEQEARKPVDIGNFKQRMSNAAGGALAGMEGRPFKSRYGAPPDGQTPMDQSNPGYSSPSAMPAPAPIGGPPPSAPAPAPWRSALNKAGQVAGGIQRGMQPPPPQQPPQQQAGSIMFGGGGIVDHPTRAIIGEDGPEAVIPLHPRPGARMRPSAVFGKRYGAA